MSHNVLINGTSHKITGGGTKVNGTSYQIEQGKVLIGGINKTLNFKGSFRLYDYTGDFVATYSYDSGMTWESFINSSYNVDKKFTADPYSTRVFYNTGSYETYIYESMHGQAPALEVSSVIQSKDYYYGYP